MKCLYCNQTFSHSLTLQEIFRFSFILPKQLCPRCCKLFTPITKDLSCPLCQKSGSKEVCTDCRQWKQKFPNYSFHHQAIFQYNEAMHDWFSLYKFKGHRQLAGCFAQEIQKAMKAYGRKQMIIPIPLSAQRLKTRGFNQVEEILNQAGLAYFPILKKKSTPDETPQSSKSREQRLLTPQPFYFSKKAQKLCNGKEILLIDDIYTTGQTLFHAADCLRRTEPKHIQTFSLAR